jgi:hypothetical protein
MGIRGELFSTRFACEGRTYFFNVKQNRNGDVFLSIVESKPSEGESFDRRSIVVFGESMEGFLKSFQSALKYMDKTGNKVDPDPTASSRYEEDERLGRLEPRKRTDAPRHEGQRSEHGSSYRDNPKTEGRPVRKYTLKPRDGTSRDGIAREVSSHEGGPRTSASRTSAPRTLTGRMAGPRASSPRAAGARDGAPRDAAPREGAPRRIAADARRQDKPVKRIVVRRTKSKDSEA